MLCGYLVNKIPRESVPLMGPLCHCDTFCVCSKMLKNTIVSGKLDFEMTALSIRSMNPVMQEPLKHCTQTQNMAV